MQYSPTSGDSERETNTMRIIIVSGTSGSGKSSALNQLEDLGYYCVDNLPIALVSFLIEHFSQQSSASHKGLAICIDIRTEYAGVTDFRDYLKTLREGLELQLIFFDATSQALSKRFNETRRRHPLSKDGLSLNDAIAAERQLLEPLASAADLIVDTSEMSPYQQRAVVSERVDATDTNSLSIQIQSFGFKKGAPVDADIVLDMRMLANPHWEPELRAFTGQAPGVIDFLESHDQTHEVANDLIEMLIRWVPMYKASQRAYLSIAVGCTGGKHRSVYMTERVGKALADQFSNVTVLHRDMPRS
ncbi:MAG: RNase adapter RapZ [Pseudomonadota bacterium]|nr:RNase adapter RapZ [Pseudomonadota bacterium]